VNYVFSNGYKDKEIPIVSGRDGANSKLAIRHLSMSKDAQQLSTNNKSGFVITGELTGIQADSKVHVGMECSAPDVSLWRQQIPLPAALAAAMQ
jgi:hypothetical protein